jgi:ppGpp synthetase/RelA/SpoT-type nucleotidyltranferase
MALYDQLDTNYSKQDGRKCAEAASSSTSEDKILLRIQKQCLRGKEFFFSPCLSSDTRIKKTEELVMKLQKRRSFCTYQNKMQDSAAQACILLHVT